MGSPLPTLRMRPSPENAKNFYDARAGNEKAKARQVQYNYGDLYLYCAQHTLGSHVGIYNYEHFGNLYTTGPKDFFVRQK